MTSVTFLVAHSLKGLESSIISEIFLQMIILFIIFKGRRNRVVFSYIVSTFIADIITISSSFH